MSRINRRKTDPSYMGLKGCGGLTDAFDDMIKAGYRISDEEYDTICEIATDEELNILISDKKTYEDKRNIINILNKYISY